MGSGQRGDRGLGDRGYAARGGAVCRRGAFRARGELARPPRGDRQRGPAANRLVTNAVLTLLLVVLGLLLLYAYRAQTPSVPQVSITAAIQDVQAGKIRSVIIVGNKATLEFRNGTQREQTTLPEQDQLFAKAVVDYNAAQYRQRGRSRLSVRRKQLLDHRVDRSQPAPRAAHRGLLLLHDENAREVVVRCCTGLFRSKTSPELGLGQKVLALVAACARRQDVFDQIRTASPERGAVLRLESS